MITMTTIQTMSSMRVKFPSRIHTRSHCDSSHHFTNDIFSRIVNSQSLFAQNILCKV